MALLKFDQPFSNALKISYKPVEQLLGCKLWKIFLQHNIFFVFFTNLSLSKGLQTSGPESILNLLLHLQTGWILVRTLNVFFLYSMLL